MGDKKTILLLCGGRSTEHEISIQSAKKVVAVLDQANQYRLLVVYINQQEEWHLIDAPEVFVQHHPSQLVRQQRTDYVTPLLGAVQATLMSVGEPTRRYVIDCVFPLLHGTYGEDGCLQGLLELMQVAYVGANVLGSALSMDKDITKQLLEANAIRTVPWRLLRRGQIRDGLYDSLKEALGATLFIKPASLGSSVGVSKVGTEADFLQALTQAFQYDHCVLIEKALNARELECAVLGNDEPIAAFPGEVQTYAGSYSYDAKYLNPQGATTVVPAELDASLAAQVRQIAVAAFQVLRCRGMLRVDFFLADDGSLYVNEVNTIPGFTPISLYPLMWQQSGINYSELLDTLILLAIEQQQSDRSLNRVYSPVIDKSPDS